MATPLTPDQLLAALRTEGVHFAEHPGWRTHNRAGHGPWGPVHGVMIHHTAGRDSLALVYNGRADLPGPLAHAHAAKSGTVTLTGNGRANHAGTIASNAYDAVLAEAKVHPRPDAAEPLDGNTCFYGIEIENLGDHHDPYPAAQYDAAVRWAAAICRAHGWHADSVIGHGEATRRKVDPSFDMIAFRAAVAARLKTPTAPAVPKPPAPKPYTPPRYPSGLAPNKAKPSARTLQRALKAAGYMPASVKEADNYGPATQAAVAKFHNAHPAYRARGTTHDIAIGPQGWAALFRLAYDK